MKVFNLTDVETPELKQRGLVNHTLVVGPFLLEPGASCEVSEAQIAHLRPGIRNLINEGALALGDQPPAPYVVAKAKLAEVDKAPPPPLPPQASGPPSRVSSRRKDRG